MRSGAAPHVPSHIIARLWRTSVRIGEERFRNNASGGIRFEFTTFHISEIGNAVFQEIEERHYRGDEFIRKNVIAVYRFNAQQKIIHLDIYEQARDSGQWIIQAAQEAGVP